MPNRPSPIDTLGIGEKVLRLSKTLGVRKIASRLEREGVLFEGRPISKSTIHRWLQSHKKGAKKPPHPSRKRPAKTMAPQGHPVDLDVERETVDMFKSCRKLFDTQLDAINKAIENGQKVNPQSLYALLGTAKTLLLQLDMYLKKVEGMMSGASLNIYINEYNTRTVMLIEHVAKEVIKDATIHDRFINALAEGLANPPKEVLPAEEPD